MNVHQGSEQGLHVSLGCFLSEHRVALTGDFCKEVTSTNVLHHKVKKLSVIIGLVVLANVGVIKFVKDRHLLVNQVDFISQFDLV